MSKNYKRPGDTLHFIAAGALTGGNAHVQVDAFGVINSTVATGEVAVLNITGIHELPAVSGDTIAVGTKLFWNGTAVTTTVSTNKPIGYGASIKAPGSTLVDVRLIPGLS